MRLTGRSPDPLGCRLARADALALPTGHPAQPGGFDHGIFISVDGLSAGLFRHLIENDLAEDDANCRRFGYDSATAFNACSDYAHAVTLPNHITLSIGWAVLQPADHPNTVRHCYTND